MSPVVDVSKPGTEILGTTDGLLRVRTHPSDPKKMMACGLMHVPNAPDIAVGYVDASDDGGATWKPVLRDTSGAWVSEESCAYGSSGSRVYFAASISRHDNASSDFHVLRSLDGGASWRQTFLLPRAWADLTFAATLPAIFGDELVVFANTLTQKTGSRSVTSAAPVAIVLRNGETIEKIVSPSDGRSRSNFLTSDVAIVSGTSLIFAGSGNVVRLSSSGARITYEPDAFQYRRGASIAPASRLAGAEAARPVISDVGGAAPGDPSIAADRSSGAHAGRVYAAWSSVDAKRAGSNAASTLWLATSDDGGKRWRRRALLQSRGIWSGACEHASIFGTARLSVNVRGTLALLWAENGHTLLLSYSNDGGATFARALVVDRTDSRDVPEVALLPRRHPNLDDLRRSDETGDFLESNDPEPLSLQAFIVEPALHQLALVADRLGVFHAFWSSSGGVLHTRRLELPRAPVRGAPLADIASPNDCALADVAGVHPYQVRAARFTASGRGFVDHSESLAPSLDTSTYDYDAGSHTMHLRVRFLNKGRTTIPMPLDLVATAVGSDFGTARVPAADTQIGGFPAWRLRAEGTGALAPGTMTAPVDIAVRVSNFRPPRSWVYDEGSFAALALSAVQPVAERRKR